MFSCGHLFLSNRKQRGLSAMSKRGQEGTSKESSKIAKPRSMNLVMSKPRPSNLVPYNMLSAKKDSSQDMSDSDNSGNAKAEQGGVSTCVWKQMKNTSLYPCEHSESRAATGKTLEIEIPGSRQREANIQTPHASGNRGKVWAHI